MQTKNEILLINGFFEAKAANTLLTELINTKIQFHHNKIGVTEIHEEDIKHAERRVLDLEDELRNAIKVISSNRVKIYAKIEIEIV